MVDIKKNFINDTENNFLSSILDERLDHSKEREDLFYEWYAIPFEDKLFDDIQFLRLFNKNLSYAKLHFSSYLKIDYVGFAYQTKGFGYHADSVWPEDPEYRSLGEPEKNENTYKNYDGSWVPNYASHRKYTTVLYLNDDFEGGETHFPTLDILTKPEKNKILGFRCDENFVHGVMPTYNGVRKAFICWFK